MDRCISNASSLNSVVIGDHFEVALAKWRVLLRRALSTVLVNSKSSLDRSVTLLFQERSRKKKMATLNEYTSVLASILSDISGHSDGNFIYILPANKCQQQIRNNDRKNTNKMPKSPFVYKHTSHVTKAAGIEDFWIPKKGERCHENKSFS